MIPLDMAEKWEKRGDETAARLLRPRELEAYEAIPPEQRKTAWHDLLEHPISSFTPQNEVFFRGRWEEVFRWAVRDTPVVLEIASGDADMVPQMMGRAFPGSRYITANMNKALTASLLARTAGLPVEMTVVEEDAAFLAGKLGAESVDLIVFQHAVNDVLQAILCDRDGIDTIEADWMAILPDMIRILQQEVAGGTLEQSLKTPFLGLLDTLRGLLRPGGILAMNHYMFQLDLDWGYPPDLFEHMIPMIRGWMGDCAGYREVLVDGFHPNWWIFLRRAED